MVRTTSAITTFDLGSAGNSDGGILRPWRSRRCPAYQPPTRHSTTMPTSDAAVNQDTLVWPNGTTMKAASNGPAAWPKFPPSWNTDCAKPNRPPDASRATRDDSGWKMAEPRPISIAPMTSTV